MRHSLRIIYGTQQPSPHFQVSQDPSNYRDAPTEGIRRILESITGEKIPRGQTLKTDKIGINPFTFQWPQNLMNRWRLHSFIYNRRYKCSSRTKGTKAWLVDYKRFQGNSCQSDTSGITLMKRSTLGYSSNWQSVSS